MLSRKMEKAFSEQINKELHSSYIYLAMAAYFENRNLKGFAKWMRTQVLEENCHAMILYNYVFERGGMVSLPAIEGVSTEFSSPVDVFEKALAHEQFITASINSLMEAALQEKDFAAQSLLNWFVDEQVEEEANAQEVVERLKMAGASDAGLLFLDQQMGTRTFTLPTPLQGKL